MVGRKEVLQLQMQQHCGLPVVIIELVQIILQVVLQPDTTGEMGCQDILFNPFQGVRQVPDLIRVGFSHHLFRQ